MYAYCSIYSCFNASLINSSTDLSSEINLFNVFSAAFLSKPKETKAFNPSLVFNEEWTNLKN